MNNQSFNFASDEEIREIKAKQPEDRTLEDLAKVHADSSRWVLDAHANFNQAEYDAMKKELLG